MKYENQLFKHIVNFYIQDGQDLEKIIFQNRKFLAILFGFVKFITRSVRGVFIFCSTFFILYNKFYIPFESTKIYAYGLTNNNIKVFKIFGIIINDGAGFFSINGREVGLFHKFTVLAANYRELYRLASAVPTDWKGNFYCKLQLMMTITSYWFYRYYYVTRPIDFLVVANDHAPLPVGMFYAAKALDIPVCYFQHAAVNSEFPPLKYDLSILHDRRSLDMYIKAGTISPFIDDSNICYVTRFSEDFGGLNIPTSKIKNVGVGLSFDTNIDELILLIEDIISFDVEASVILRRHPRDDRSYSRVLDAFGSSVFIVDDDSFFCKIDIAIVANTGMSIDCLHKGVPTFYHGALDNFSDDYYGFVRDGLLPRYTSINKLDLSFFCGTWLNLFSGFDSTVETGFAYQLAAVRSILKRRFDVFNQI
jgi:hypothetical protein